MNLCQASGGIKPKSTNCRATSQVSQAIAGRATSGTSRSCSASNVALPWSKTTTHQADIKTSKSSLKQVACPLRITSLWIWTRLHRHEGVRAAQDTVSSDTDSEWEWVTAWSPFVSGVPRLNLHLARECQVTSGARSSNKNELQHFFGFHGWMGLIAALLRKWCQKSSLTLGRQRDICFIWPPDPKRERVQVLQLKGRRQHITRLWKFHVCFLRSSARAQNAMASHSGITRKQKGQSDQSGSRRPPHASPSSKVTHLFCQFGNFSIQCTLSSIRKALPIMIFPNNPNFPSSSMSLDAPQAPQTKKLSDTLPPRRWIGELHSRGLCVQRHSGKGINILKRAPNWLNKYVHC